MKKKRSKIRQPYHLVSPSPWPLTASFSAFTLTIGACLYMHSYAYGFFTLVVGFLNLIITIGFWFRDIIRESTFQGAHTSFVQKGLRLGFALFILSEVMFFFSFFWAYFHSALAPTIWIATWPPNGINTPSALGIPLLNTIILVFSGITITYTHSSLILNKEQDTLLGFILTLFLAFLFTFCQAYEYIHLNFSIACSVFGSLFYMLTGFHGLHVIIGTIFIFICFVRFLLSHFTVEQHLGLEFAIWYWHFVDVVWICLYFIVYWWGSLGGL